MFGKKKRRILVTQEEVKVTLKQVTGKKTSSLEEVQDIVTAFAKMVESQTDMKATTFLTKCAFDLLP